MVMRSLLMVPAAAAADLAAAFSTQADALIFDLTDHGRLPTTANLRALKKDDGTVARIKVFIRVNTLASGLVDNDLATAMPAHPDGIVLPEAIGIVDVEHLAAKIRVLEAQLGRADGETRIIPLISSPSGVLAAGGMRPHPRIAAIGWEMFHPLLRRGVSSLLDEEGRYHDVPRLTRTLTLLAASQAGVVAIDGPTPFDSDAAFYRVSAQAQRDGFTAKVARTEAQVRAVNDIF